MQDLLPEPDFRLFAVTVRFPQGLAQQVPFTKVQPGVYDLRHYGATHYHLRSEETSTLLLQLFKRYRLEAIPMPDILEQFAAETIDELLKELPVEKRLKGLPAEERLKGLSAEERLKGLSLSEFLAELSEEKRAALAKLLKDNGFPPASKK